MFADTRREKVKSIVLPVALWVAAGMAVELLAVLWELLRLRGAGDVSRDFLSLLSLAHEEGELWLLLLRDLLALPFLFLFFRKDEKRIRAEAPLLPGEAAESPLFQKKRVPLGILLLAIPAAIAASVFLNLLLGQLGLLPAEESGGELFGSRGVLLILFSLIVAPVTEELLCRGLIYRRMRTYAPPLWALLTSAAVFALLHWDPAQSLLAFFLGLLFGNLYEWSGKLFLPIAAHTVCNLTALIINACFLPIEAPGLWTFVSGAVLLGAVLLLAHEAGRKKGSGSPSEQEEK